MGRALGELEQLVLFAVVELEDDAYGASVVRSIEQRTGRLISAGAVYTALLRLQDRGFVNSSIAPPTGERGGRRRKVYEVTPEGAVDLRRSVERIRAMSAGLMGKLDALTERAG